MFQHVHITQQESPGCSLGRERRLGDGLLLLTIQEQRGVRAGLSGKVSGGCKSISLLDADRVLLIAFQMLCWDLFTLHDENEVRL